MEFSTLTLRRILVWGPQMLSLHKDTTDYQKHELTHVQVLWMPEIRGGLGGTVSEPSALQQC